MNKLLPSVSILTITQWKRNTQLRQLVNIINLQTYKNIQEWVIVEGGGYDSSTILLNETFIKNELPKLTNIPIKYVQYSGTDFATMYNMGNDACEKDIIVIMEDDDFYFSDRVSHVVDKFNLNPSFDLAGCSGILVYFQDDNTLQKFNDFGYYHSCNHALAYKKEYLLKNRYKSNGFSIEPSFLNNYTSPMLQLNPYKTIIKINHRDNTFNWVPLKEIWIENKQLRKIHKYPKQLLNYLSELNN